MTNTSTNSELIERLIDAIARDSRGIDPASLTDGARSVWRRDVLAILSEMRGSPDSEPPWASNADPVGALAIKLCAHANAVEEDCGEWTWRDIAEAATIADAGREALAPGPLGSTDQPAKDSLTIRAGEQNTTDPTDHQAPNSGRE